LQDTTGAAHTPLAADKRRATVILFLMHDCPVANASSPAIARLAAEFESRGVKFFGVYATETAQEIAKHRADFKLPFPGLLDPQCQLARQAGATRVPEAAVFSPSGELLYRGRIDDRAVRPGLTRPVPQHEDLRLALTAILAGRAPEPKFTPAIGCHLPLE
jgi:AhpC/TSA family